MAVFAFIIIQNNKAMISIEILNQINFILIWIISPSRTNKNFKDFISLCFFARAFFHVYDMMIYIMETKGWRI